MSISNNPNPLGGGAPYEAGGTPGVFSSVITPSVTAPASTDLTLAAGSGNQNLNLNPSGTGRIVFGAGGFAGVTNGKGAFYGDSVNGAIFFGQGTTADFSVLNKTGAITLSIPTGTQHLLLGGLTVDGTGVLQFPAATANTGGLNFGTEIFFFRTGTNTAQISASAGLAITGNVTVPGLLNNTGTSANSGNGLTQRFRNGYATAGQAPAATTRTYITGSDIGPFTAGQLIVGTWIHWHLKIVKTAAGTASSTFDICFGTAGSTADTARVTFTKPAGVAQADDCTVDIYAQVKTNSATGVVVGDFTLYDNQTNALGGFLAAAKWVYAAPLVTSGTFDTTTPTHVGLCITTGASDAYTIDQCMVECFNA